jgi:hypothetical protein
MVLDDYESSDAESSRPGIDSLLGSGSSFDDDESTARSTFTEYSLYTADSTHTGNSASVYSASIKSEYTDDAMYSDNSDSSDIDSDSSGSAASESIVSDKSALNSIVSENYAMNSIVGDTWDERCFPEMDYKFCGVTF